MHPLFDFGISQEDPLTELAILDLLPGDRLLCIASGGELPLSLLCLQKGLHITAVDVSEAQLRLCRLKMLTAMELEFPLNGAFLGFSPMEAGQRQELFHDRLGVLMGYHDRMYWQQHIRAIGSGVVHAGRFETYIRRLRPLLYLLAGKENLMALLQCTTTAEQVRVFDSRIAGRKGMRNLFRLAFHPLVYRNRGIAAAGLQHAHAHTGDRFFAAFRNFCTATPACWNYFLHYLLAGECLSKPAFPEYLWAGSGELLRQQAWRLVWQHSSLETALGASPPGTYNKIHLSNVGDWMDQAAFSRLEHLIHTRVTGEAALCYRYLQKNHWQQHQGSKGRFTIRKEEIAGSDRFPFYQVLSLRSHD